MAVAAINAVVSHVMFVAKLDGLLSLNPLAGVPGRTVQLNCNPQSGKENKDSAINRELGQRVCAVMEDLWHRRSAKSEALQTTSELNCKLGAHTGAWADSYGTQESLELIVLLQSECTLPDDPDFSNSPTLRQIKSVCLIP